MDIEELKDKKRIYNLAELRNCLNESWVIAKVENYLERNRFVLKGYTVQNIIEKIKTDDCFALYFIKDPNKQNDIEKIIGKELSTTNGINNFVNYPSTIKLFVVNGEITNNRPITGKSIDYSCTTNKGRQVYFTQKYTKGNGGAQDNQFQDVVNFLSNTVGNDECIFVALVNGSYYTEAKMNILKEFERENVIVCGFEKIGEILEGK